MGGLNALYDVPAVVVLIVALAGAILISSAGQAGVHRLFRNQDFIDHNEIGGIIIVVAGTLYAVVLGFLTVDAWRHYVEAHQLAVQESDADIDAWHTAVGLPAAVRDRVRNDMVSCADIMIAKE
ncbi:MAG: hypothetical protein ABSD74_15765 [Rhizomicrobium sp.]